MNLRKEIRQAYDHIQVPDDVTERLKQELYQKDFHEEEEFTEMFQISEYPKRNFGRYLSFIAASVMLGVSIGISMWNMLDNRAEEVFHPTSTIPVERSSEITEEPTTAPTEEEEAEEAESHVYLRSDG